MPIRLGDPEADAACFVYIRGGLLSWCTACLVVETPIPVT